MVCTANIGRDIHFQGQITIYYYLNPPSVICRLIVVVVNLTGPAVLVVTVLENKLWAQKQDVPSDQHNPKASGMHKRPC